MVLPHLTFHCLPKETWPQRSQPCMPVNVHHVYLSACLPADLSSACLSIGVVADGVRGVQVVDCEVSSHGAHGIQVRHIVEWTSLLRLLLSLKPLL